MSRNFGSELVTRFLGGLSSSPTLSVYGGTLADLFSDEERKARWPLFALSPLLGPVLAPLVGGWIHDAGTDWRWTLWIGLAFGGAAFLLALVVLPETFSPILLYWKAKHLRKITGNEKYVAEIERGEPLVKRLRTNLTRPATFFTTEAIVIFLGAYLVLIFVINFSFLSGLDFIFTMKYDLSPGITALAFVSIAVGVLIDVSVTPLYNRLANRVHRRQCRAFVKRKEVNTSTSDLESVASNTADHTAAVETLQDVPPALESHRTLTVWIADNPRWYKNSSPRPSFQEPDRFQSCSFPTLTIEMRVFATLLLAAGVAVAVPAPRTFDQPSHDRCGNFWPISSGANVGRSKEIHIDCRRPGQL